MRSSRRRTSRRLWLSAGLIVAGGLWLVGFVIFAVSLPTDIESPERKTDAIAVLTGGSLRLESGLQLLEEERARKLFVSGVHRGIDVEELLRVSLQNPSRADCCIVLGYEADDTAGNAQETAEWMKKEGYRSLRLVTAAYHMPRSLVEFQAAMPDVEIIAHPVFPDHVKSSSWYRYPGTALLLAGEYTKTLLAFIRNVDELVTAP
ncbi:MAG: YdcF family protein [Alphaproteobacteria bacterium]